MRAVGVMSKLEMRTAPVSCFHRRPAFSSAFGSLKPYLLAHRRTSHIVFSSRDDPMQPKWRQDEQNIEAQLRAEAEAPFRPVRLTIFGASCVGTGIATLIATTQLIGAVAGAPNAFPLEDALQNFGIDLAGLGFFSFLVYQDIKARNKQLARLQREEKLAACQLELSSGKVLRLGELRGKVRAVVVAGTEAQVAAAVQAATPLREQLAERSVFIITVPIYSTPGAGAEDGGQGSAEQLTSLAKEDLRWRAGAVRTEDWAGWFAEQLALSSKTADQGLYVGLRLDGRVRASGTGTPPWRRFVAELAPTDSGMFQGLLDGMDGRV